MSSPLRKAVNYLQITIATLIVLLTIAVGLIPPAMQWGITAWLEQQNLEGQIEEIHLQLFRGRLVIENFSITKGQQKLLSLGSLVIRISLQDLLEQKIVLKQFSLRDFDLSVEQKQDQTFSIAGLSLPASSSTEKPAAHKDTAPWHLDIQNIDLDRLQSCFQSKVNNTRKLCASLKQLKWNGQLQLSLYPETTDFINSLHSNLSLDLHELQLRDANKNSTLMSIDHIALQQIQMQSLNNISINKIDLNDIVALQRQSASDDAKKNYVLKSLALNAKNISVLNQDKIAITSLDTHRLMLVLHRKSGGESASPLAINLAEFSILDNSSFHFIDNAVKPNSKIELKDINLTVKQINSDKQSLPSPVQLALGLGQHGQLQLKGEVLPFAKRPTLTLDGHLKSINVGNFNAYTQQSIQHYIKSGHLDAEINVTIKSGQLDSKTQLTLHKFYVEPLSETEASQYKEQLGLPLGTALSLLRDRDDSINLELPVSGDINAPDFSINDIVGKVTGKAIKTAVINYYSPLGLLKLAEGLFNLATAFHFGPVNFDVSKAVLDEQDQVQLDKLALVLVDRPQLHLVICGKSTQADRLAWFSAEFENSTNEKGETISTLPKLEEKQKLRLEELAAKRSTIVKDYLHKQKTIEPSRLILCAPKHHPGDKQPPRTELQL